MKSKVILMLLTTMFSLFPIYGVVQVLTPNLQNLMIFRGGNYPITWFDDIPVNVAIELYQNDSLHSIISSSTTSDGSYLWAVPNIIGDNFKVRIRTTNTFYAGDDTSDGYFRIIGGSINCLTPIENETIQVIDSIHVTWDDDIPEDVKITLYENSIIHSSVTCTSDGDYFYRIDNTTLEESSYYKFTVESTLFPEIIDETGVFHVDVNYINITEPAGGDIFIKPESILLKWNFITNSNLTKEVNVFLYKGTTQIDSKLGIMNDSLFFPINYDKIESGNDYKFRVVSTVMPAANKNSGIFTIDADPDPYFEKKFDGSYWDEGNYIQQTSDGGLIITGHISYDLCVIKTDQYGNEAWNKTYNSKIILTQTNGKCIKETSDGGFIVLGSYAQYETEGLEPGYFINGNVILMKLDSLGNKLWSTMIDSFNDDEPQTLLLTEDGGCLIVSIYYTYEIGIPSIWIIKTNSAGGIEWQNNHSDAEWVGKTCRNHCITETSDKCYLLTYNYDNGGIFIRKIDSTGHVLWDKNILPGDYYHSKCICRTSDNNFILTGDSSTGRVILAKINEDGELYWNKLIGEDGYRGGVAVQQTNDLGFIILADKYNFWLIKTDQDGNIEWEKEFGVKYSGKPAFLQQTQDNGFAITGTASAYVNGTDDIWLIKTDANGTPIEDVPVPETTHLFQNYPNPFNPVTTIEYSLEKDSQVQIKIFNSNGSMVADLVNGKQKAGYRNVEFDASMLSSGIYYYTLIVDSKSITTKKMLMLK